MRARALLAIVVPLCLVPAPAGGQQPPPTASAKARPAEKPPGAATGGPATGAPAGADAGGAGDLPPGHPPVGQELPSGHPPVAASAHPGGAPPPSHAQRPKGPGFFEPPPDTATDDPTLPPGTIAVTIADAEDKPIPSAPLTLGILRNTVAKGESRERLAREVGEDGSFRFDGLEHGSGVTYRVSTDRGKASYAVTPFALGDKAGKRVRLHSYEVASDIEEVLVGVQGIVYLSLREDAMSIEHLFNVFNLGPVSWVPEDVVIALPEGFKAFNKPEQMEDTRFERVDDKGAALRGTFSPGRHDMTFRYQVPLEGTARQTFTIELPPHMAQMQVMAEASKSMGLEVKGFPAAQKSTNRDGKRILVTQRQVGRSEGGIKSLEITIAGLPERSASPWIALLLGAGAIGGGFLYAYQRRQDEELPEDTRSDLLEAQRALLDEIVALERAHRSGEVGPKTYARVRAALLDALARIVTMLEGPQRGGAS